MKRQRPRRRTARPRSIRMTSQQSADSGFDFTAKMRLLCADAIFRLPQLGHIDLDRVAISFSQARKRVDHGYHATLTPMRFEDGSLTSIRNNDRYTVQRLYDADGREMLYILSFYLPRFMDVDFREKLVTIFHELWHINPHFNGDLRRFEGRCYAHTGSQKKYDEEMAQLVDRYLACEPPEPLHRFLKYRFDELHQQHGRVYGMKIPHPKLIPVR